MATTLELVLLYLVAAVLGVVACRMLRLPPMLGYLAVGVLIGPNALALAKDTAGVKYLVKCRSSGRATALLAAFTFKRKRLLMNALMFAITRCPARSLRT